MNKQIIGSIFFLMTTILYSTKYITAAIAGADNGAWGEKDFVLYLSFTPSIFNVFIYFTMLIGIIYFVWGISDSKKETT
ncbi:hypothetical protein [Rossellomorea aquimaris]|jgi:hypothetical protein|uniref:hypothetical protein n=1 Tax=Rossellomorea aquimaris TaxID=189382 RepID=UPI0011E940A4|nr:hypothetical protein [Rossellomorea aquimaris]TYS89924.1 hypothetical protein FZC88_10070 [Rossellomorea aquimaris]WRP07402.1 hypothetical protein U9J35_04330 [Rossellomorea aquimaris]